MEMKLEWWIETELGSYSNDIILVIIFDGKLKVK